MHVYIINEEVEELMHKIIIIPHNNIPFLYFPDIH